MHRSKLYIALIQAIASGGTFFTTILLARILPISDFGTFSIILISASILATMHHGLITSPMASIGARIIQEEQCTQNHYISILIKISIFALSFTLITITTIQALWDWRNENITETGFIFAASCLIISFTLKDFQKRVLIYAEMYKEALIYEIFFLTTPIVAITYLSAANLLTTQTLITTYAIIYTLALHGLLYKFGLSSKLNTKSILKRQKKFSIHQIFSAVLSISLFPLFFIYAGIFFDKTTVAALRISQNITSIGIAAIQILENITPKQYTEILIRKGERALTKTLNKHLIISLYLAAAFVVIFIFFGRQLISITYGVKYEFAHAYLIGMAITTGMSGLLFFYQSQLKAKENTRAILNSYIFASAINIPLQPLIMKETGILAGMTLLIATQIAIMINYANLTYERK